MNVINVFCSSTILFFDSSDELYTCDTFSTIEIGNYGNNKKQDTIMGGNQNVGILDS